MLSLIRRALDAKRLTAELVAAEDEIAALKKELSGRLLGPSFREVAKSFDASAHFECLMDGLFREMSPMLEREAVSFLKSAVSALGVRRKNHQLMEGAVAFDSFANEHVFEFRVGAMGVLIRSRGM